MHKFQYRSTTNMKKIQGNISPPKDCNTEFKGNIGSISNKQLQKRKLEKTLCPSLSAATFSWLRSLRSSHLETYEQSMCLVEWSLQGPVLSELSWISSPCEHLDFVLPLPGSISEETNHLIFLIPRQAVMKPNMVSDALYGDYNLELLILSSPSEC